MHERVCVWEWIWCGWAAVKAEGEENEESSLAADAVQERLVQRIQHLLMCNTLLVRSNAVLASLLLAPPPAVAAA